MKIIQGKHNVAKIFATTIEESCEAQVLDLCNESWIAGSNIRIMADCHSGKGCVIGTTMTITDKVVPNLVGVDIGCGVLTVNSGNIDIDFEQFDRIVKRNIPVGREIRAASNILIDFTSDCESLCCKDVIDSRQVSRSLGSLGGGNHYIEIDKDDDGNKFLVIHTGSRNFGKRVAEHYQNLAVKYHKDKIVKSAKDIIEELKAKNLHHLIKGELDARKALVNEELTYLEGELFEAYLNDMQIAQKMASLNRLAIADVICRCCHIKPLEMFETIHNYIDIPNKILRKGSISAQKGEMCLIPINMRDGALICVGKGNPDFNFSAPHGAGRLMSRKAAKHNLSLTEFKDTMKNVYSSTVNESTLDEAPDAYKPIDEILENIKDTVDVVKRIWPLYNLKAED